MGADTKKMRNLRPICPGGEIGRRDSFRFYWIHVLVGSSPVPGTLYYFPSLRGCLFLIRKHRHAFDFFCTNSPTAASETAAQTWGG